MSDGLLLPEATESAANRRQTQLRWCVVIALVFSFAGFNLTVANTFDEGPDDAFSALILGGSIGVVIGQINLISIWAAMAPGRVVQRLPWSILLTVLLWYSIILGDPRPSAGGTVELGIILIVAQIIAQLPLWIGSQVFRYQLTPRTAAAQRGQFSLGDMLVGTSLLAITLSLCRFLIPSEEIRWEAMDVMELIPMLALGTLAVANQVTVVPFIWAAFRPKRQFVSLLAAASGILLLVSVLVFVMMNAILGPFGPDSSEVFLFFAAIIFAQSVAVVLTLLILRLCGFRLIRISR